MRYSPLLFAAATLAFGSSAMAQPKMAPKAAVKAPATRFTFVAYGDTRSNPDAHRAIIQTIIQQKPEFVLQSGDLVSDGRNKSQWAEFDQITAPLRAAHIAYYPARGNHDLGSYYQDRVREPIRSGNKYYYSFERHRNLFIALDEFQDYDPSSTQYRWLEDQLKYGQVHDVNTWVLFHESPFSVGPHGPTPEALAYLHPLFTKYKTRAVVCGHDHLYYRTKRDGVTYLVTGGGGAPLYDPIHTELAVPGDVYVKDFHIIRLDVDGKSVKGTVITPDGKTIDRFSL